MTDITERKQRYLRTPGNGKWNPQKPPADVDLLRSKPEGCSCTELVQRRESLTDGRTPAETAETESACRMEAVGTA